MSLGYRIPQAFKFITLARWIRSDHRLFTRWEYQLRDAATARLKRQLDGARVAQPTPLPEVDADIDPETFRQRFVARPHPVVIRGLAADLPAVRRWNRAFFEERYGETQVHAYNANYQTESGEIEYEERKCSLKEAINTAGLYLDTSHDVFLAHPELEDDLAAIRAWGKYLGNALFLMPQAFLGWQAEGAPFHCANGWNFFVMVDGEKEWTFVDPEYTLQLGALTHPTVITIEGCVTGKGGTWRDSHEIYAEYCPRYTTVVRPGDVIMNPPWWWHEIKNTSPFSIGVSSRWLLRSYPPTNALFDAMSYASPGMWKLKMAFMKAFDGAPPPDGEDPLRNAVGRKQPRYERYFEDFVKRSQRRDEENPDPS